MYEPSKTRLCRRSSFAGPSSIDRSSGLVAAPPPTPVASVFEKVFASVYETPPRSLDPRVLGARLQGVVVDESEVLIQR